MALGQIHIFRAEIIIESEVKLTSLSLYNKPIRRYVRIGFLCYFIGIPCRKQRPDYRSAGNAMAPFFKNSMFSSRSMTSRLV